MIFLVRPDSQEFQLLNISTDYIRELQTNLSKYSSLQGQTGSIK